jgi:hypothetical protein
MNILFSSGTTVSCPSAFPLTWSRCIIIISLHTSGTGQPVGHVRTQHFLQAPTEVQCSAISTHRGCYMLAPPVCCLSIAPPQQAITDHFPFQLPMSMTVRYCQPLAAPRWSKHFRSWTTQ